MNRDEPTEGSYAESFITLMATIISWVGERTAWTHDAINGSNECRSLRLSAESKPFDEKMSKDFLIVVINDRIRPRSTKQIHPPVCPVMIDKFTPLA